MLHKKEHHILIVLTVGLLILGWIFNSLITVYAAVLVQLMIFVYPRGAVIISKGWMLLGNFLGTFNTFIILTLLYIFILTPTAILFRIFSNDKHGMRKAPMGTNYVTVDKLFGPDDLDRMW